MAVLLLRQQHTRGPHSLRLSGCCPLRPVPEGVPKLARARRAIYGAGRRAPGDRSDAGSDEPELDSLAECLAVGLGAELHLRALKSLLDCILGHIELIGDLFEPEPPVQVA